MKIYRNDPCPCGSGKKYKKCCELKNVTFENKSPQKKEHFISGNVPVSFDMPVFFKEFFTKVKTGLTAFGLINSCILRPEIEKIASQFTNSQLDRGKSEAKKIQQCKNVSELIKILKAGIDNLNHVLMQKLFLEKPEESVAALMLELQNAVPEMFIEISVRTIALAKINVANDLMTIIKKHDKSIYQISLLCLLLGYQKHPAIPQFLWNYYRFFKSQYPDQDYWEGPFYGLWEQWARATFDDKKESAEVGSFNKADERTAP